MEGTGIIRFPKHQSWISGPGAYVGRLGAEPGQGLVAGLASGAHYKAGREVARARCEESEGRVSCLCLMGLFRLRGRALGSGSLLS